MHMYRLGLVQCMRFPQSELAPVRLLRISAIVDAQVSLIVDAVSA